MFGRNYYYSPFDYVGSAAVGSAVCIFLALIAAIVLFIVFMPAKNEVKYKGFVLWLYKALNFRTMFSMGLLKFLYLLSVCFICFFGLYMLFISFAAGLAILTLGNFFTRVIYEFFILVFSIHENLSQINSNTAFLKWKAGSTAEPSKSAPVIDNAQQAGPQQQDNSQPQSDQ